MKKEKNELWEWAKVLIIAFLMAAGIRQFLFVPIMVDGESMMPTLEDGNKMIVNKIGYTIGEPQRFDIVVFHADEKKDYIKRVIGLPGDRIEYKDDVLYVNGKVYKEPYLDKYKRQVGDEPLTGSFALKDTPVGKEIVPEGQLFVMGDNRRYSKDSRHIGAIPIDEVIGKANLTFWPIDNFGLVEHYKEN